MKNILIALLVRAAHFSATPFAPARTAKFYWPFAADSKPRLGFIASLCALFGWLVPAPWFTPSIIAAAVASILLYILYIGIFSFLPITLDLILLWGVMLRGWSTEITISNSPGASTTFSTISATP